MPSVEKYEKRIWRGGFIRKGILVYNWVLFSFYSVFFSIAYNVFNQHIKVNAGLLMVWRGFGTALLLAPALFIYKIPFSGPFLFYSVCVGACIAYLDRAFFHGISIYGAGPISRIMPLFILFSLTLWWAVDPASFKILMQSPIKFSGVTFSIILIVVSLLSLRKDKISKEVLLYCRGMIVASVLKDVFAKKAFQHIESEMASLIYFIVISSFVAGLLNLLSFYVKKQSQELKQLLNGNVVKGGAIAAVFVVFMMYFRNTAIAEAPNPAYVSAIASSLPFFILLYNKIVGFPDEANKWAGAGIVIGCAVLVFCAV